MSFPNYDRYFNPQEASEGLDAYSNTFHIVDRTDPSKKVRFDVSGVTSETVRTFALPDNDLPLGSPTVVATGGEFDTPIVLDASYSGKVILLDTAAGLDFTLPALTTANVGMQFTFFLVTEVTSNSYRFTAQSGDLLSGHVIMYDKDVAEGSTEALQQLFRPDGSDDLVITIAGADDTTGALVGGWLELTAISATGWFVRGSLIGDGALATIFS